MIDSNCDVDESCPWFFIRSVLAAGPEYIIINMYVIMDAYGRRSGAKAYNGISGNKDEFGL